MRKKLSQQQALSANRSTDKSITAKIAATSVLRQYRVSKVTLDSLCAIVKDQGFELIDFDPVASNDSFNLLTKELDLPSQILQQNAFVYKRQNVKLLFIREDLSEEEKLYAVSHELGHILCGHLNHSYFSNLSVEQEHEANEFSHYLLHPSKGWKITMFIERNKWFSLLCIFVIMVISILFATRKTFPENNVGSRLLPVIEGTGYYVTSGGNKYHTSSCTMIKSRSNVREITPDELTGGIYQPCQICLSQLANDNN